MEGRETGKEDKLCEGGNERIQTGKGKRDKRCDKKGHERTGRRGIGKGSRGGVTDLPGLKIYDIEARIPKTPYCSPYWP